MRSYAPPRIDELCKSIQALRSRYLENKEKKQTAANAHRLESIYLLEQMSNAILQIPTIKQVDALIGLILFMLLKLEKKYGSWSDWLPKDNGELIQLLKSALHLSDTNTLSQQERLIYLTHFYEVPQNLNEMMYLQDTHYQTKERLIKSIDIKIKQTLKEQQNYIAYVLQSPPDFAALERNIDQAIVEYEKEYSSRWLTSFAYFKNPEREKALILLKMVQTSCKQWMSELPAQQVDKKYIDIQKNYLYDVRRGLILSIVMPIYKAHKRLSPSGSLLNHGSTLYKLLFSSLNKHYDDFSHAERIQLLKIFLNHLEKADLFANCKDLSLNNLRDNINYLIAEEEIDRSLPTTRELYTSIAINYAAQYGIKLMICQASTKVVIPQIGGLIISATVGPLGALSYGLAGTLVTAQLGQLVQAQVIDRATSLVYQYVLSAIGTYIGQYAAPGLMIAFEVTGDSLSRLLGFYQDLQKFDQEFAKRDDWVNALYHLPNHLVNDHAKLILEKTQSSLWSAHSNI